MYPLQTLFEIRERAKKNSEEAYAKEKQKLDEAQKKLDQMHEELKEMQALRRQKRDEYFAEMSSSATKIDLIKIAERHVQMLLEKEEAFKLKIAEQEQVVAEAKEVVQKALEVMMKATEEYKVLEKHKEKWALKQKKAQEQREEAEADDITQARYSNE